MTPRSLVEVKDIAWGIFSFPSLLKTAIQALKSSKAVLLFGPRADGEDGPSVRIKWQWFG